MGTRGLLGLIIQGKRHAAYNHWDSYPSTLGAKIVEFILSLKLEDIAEMAALVQVITVRTTSTRSNRSTLSLLLTSYSG